MPDREIQITAYINFAKQSVKTQEVFRDPEADLKVYLELAGFMAWRYMEYSEKRRGEVVKYVAEYVEHCIGNYEDTKLKEKNESTK